MYKKAIKEKLRFVTHVGVLTTEELTGLSLTELDELAVKLEKEYKESAGKSFIDRAKPKKDKISKLRFDIVVDILETKMKEEDTAASMLDTKAHNQKIEVIIERKKAGALEDLPIEELEALLK